jgi:hypothetical protein
VEGREYPAMYIVRMASGNRIQKLTAYLTTVPYRIVSGLLQTTKGDDRR